MTTSGTPPQSFHPFFPALGPLEHRLYRLSRQLTGTGLDVEVVEGLARDAEEDWRGNRQSERRLRWALALSILSDILVAGGTIHCVDSSLHVAWPDWSSEEGARGLRRALERLRDEMRYGHVTPEVIDVLPASMTRDVVIQLISEGTTFPAGTSVNESGSVRWQSNNHFKQLSLHIVSMSSIVNCSR